MAWPSANVSLANVDSGSDRISSARADIYDAFTKLNEIITEGPGGGGGGDSFTTIAVSGQSSVVADSTTDTLTLVAGNAIVLTTNATSDSVTITSNLVNATLNTISTFDTGTVQFNSNVVMTGVSNDVGTLIEYKEKIHALGTTSGTITVNVALAPVHTITANGNITINTTDITNIDAGQSVSVIVTQDGTGGRLLTSNLKYAGGSKTLSTAGNSIDVINVFYDGSRYLASLVKGYA